MRGFVYESRTDQIRSEPIPQLIFGLTYLLILTRFIWPIDLPLWAKIVMAALAFVALQFHRWSRLSSGSEFSPEFPRPVVVLFNWAFGAIVLLALLQLLLDVGLLVGIPIHGGIVSAPDGVRYGLAALAAVAAAIGVHQAMRIPPLKDIEVGIHGLPRQFDGYTILQLTDLHISRLFPASWARAVVERSNELGVDLIAITGDLIDGTLDARRTDIEPLADAKTTSQVLICISADSRPEVDDLISMAESAGGVIDPSPQDDYDFMYGRSFEDLDGHLWGVNWMDFEAVAKDTAATAA